MSTQKQVHVRQAFQPENAGQSDLIGSNSLYPGVDYSNQAGLPAPYSAALKSGGSIPNLTEIKAMVDRMGGIDGILATISKMQKVFQGIQQLSPMIKLIAGSLIPNKSNPSDSDYTHQRYPGRRRRRRRNGKASTRRTIVKTHGR